MGEQLGASASQIRLSSNDQAASHPDPSGFDPSRGDLIKTLQSIMDLNDLSDIYDAAQGALDRLPEAKSMRLAGLESSSAAVRYDSINWLEKHFDADVLKIMKEMLCSEPNKTVRALLKDIIADHAQGIEARSDGTQSGPAEGESPTRRDAPDPPLQEPKNATRQTGGGND